MNEPFEQDDVFEEIRSKCPVLKCRFGDEEIPMFLNHADVMAAAKDWQTFSSDAPFRVPVPSEEHLRRVRQLPIETDPPIHAEYRDLVEPFFKKPRDPEFARTISAVISNALAAVISAPCEVVSGFALPVQNRALAHLLGLPQSAAEEWISWGTHVFHDVLEGDSDGSSLDQYIERQLDRAQCSEGDDFFCSLAKAEFQGRGLTRAEMAGFANLAFAGGRDTVIHTISSVIAYLARHPEALGYLQSDPKRAVLATEEFFRVVSPLTHIGRVCPAKTHVHGLEIQPGERVSLGWAAANRDPQTFTFPHEVRLDRKPNPHVAFGAGNHFCLGAAHARLLIRELLVRLAQGVSHIEILHAVPNFESASTYKRQIGYERLEVVFRPIA